jgi:hypothetical protein
MDGFKFVSNRGSTRHIDCSYVRQNVVFPPSGDRGYLSIQLGRTLVLGTNQEMVTRRVSEGRSRIFGIPRSRFGLRYLPLNPNSLSTPILSLDGPPLICRQFIARRF